MFICYNLNKLYYLILLLNAMFGDSIYSQLRDHGLRVTPQRRAIIQALQESPPHPTAEQILARVRAVMPDMSHATVYNTLRELAAIGVLRELDLGLRERRYDMNPLNHAHLVCVRCGCIEDVPCDGEPLALLDGRVRGFHVVDYRLVFRGYCPECASQEESLGGSR